MYFNNYFCTEHIKPICLLEMPDMNKINISRTMPYVAGWGSNNPDPNDGKPKLIKS